MCCPAELQHAPRSEAPLSRPRAAPGAGMPSVGKPPQAIRLGPLSATRYQVLAFCNSEKSSAVQLNKTIHPNPSNAQIYLLRPSTAPL